MGGKNDRRATKSTIRSADGADNYFDLLVDASAAFLGPYRDSLVMMGNGNHETAILKHNETDLLARLCKELDCVHMGYSGFVRLMFQGEKGNRTTRRLYFHHGSGGGGPVTKGVIQTNRRAASVDADIFVTAHIHEAWSVENMVIKMTDAGRLYFATQHHIQCACYKQEYTTGGYHIEKGRPPKPLGGWWMVLTHDGTQLGNVGVRFERAN